MSLRAVLRMCNAAMTVVATKVSLWNVNDISNHFQSKITYQMIAPKTIAAVPAPQPPPRLPQWASPHNEATATHAANQKIIVIASTAHIAYLCASDGNLLGARTRYATASRVHTEVNSMKSTLSGDHPHQNESTTRAKSATYSVAKVILGAYSML